MRCEMCQDEEATVHLTQVVNGSVKKLHLCETCAAESGVDIHSPVSIADLLLGLGKSHKNETADPAAACPNCHMRPADFKKNGRLGCPACYEAFHDELAPLVKAMHRGEQHTGKIPRGESSRMRMTTELAVLQREMDDAVAAERFERAAELRDRIQTLRGRMDAGDGPS